MSYKQCPFCKNAIEKAGGCNHMTCSCGKSFCWKCLTKHGYRKCISVQVPIVTFVSMLFSGGSRTIHLQRIGFKYKLLAKEVHDLKQRFKIQKTISNFEYIKRHHNSLLIATARALDLLEDCYTLLENMTAAQALSRSKHLNARICRFRDGLSFILLLLKNKVNVDKLSEVNVGAVLQSINSIESYLEGLSGFGIGNHCMV